MLHVLCVRVCDNRLCINYTHSWFTRATVKAVHSASIVPVLYEIQPIKRKQEKTHFRFTDVLQYEYHRYRVPNMLISQHPCSRAARWCRLGYVSVGKQDARQAKSNRENWYVIKVKVRRFKFKQGRGYGSCSWGSAEPKAKECTKPFYYYWAVNCWKLI